MADSAELVKMYAMVNVSDYQITATGTTVAACQKAYQEQLAENGIQVKQDVKEEEPAGEERTVTGEVAEIRSSVISGNTWYYFRLKGKENACYYGISAADCPEAVTYNKGDQLTITYPISEDGTWHRRSSTRIGHPLSGTGVFCGTGTQKPSTLRHPGAPGGNSRRLLCVQSHSGSKAYSGLSGPKMVSLRLTFRRAVMRRAMTSGGSGSSDSIQLMAAVMEATEWYQDI